MGNQQILEVCIARNKEEMPTNGHKLVQIQSPKYRKALKEQAHPDAQPLSSQFSSLPFRHTHIATFKKMVDSLNVERFTIEQMAKKFSETKSAPEWQSEDIWDKQSDLYVLLKYYLPDSKGDGLVSYTSLLSVGLLLCNGSTYDKAKVLHQLVESNSSEQTVFRTDEYLSSIIYTIIEFSISKSLQFYLRPLDGTGQFNHLINKTCLDNIIFTGSRCSIDGHSHHEKNPTNLFLDSLFGNFFCLSKMDFIIILQSPGCSWIFNEELIRENVERYFLDSSTQSSSPVSCRSQTHNEECVQAKMIESQDELQFCHFEDNAESEGHIDIE